MGVGGTGVNELIRDKGLVIMSVKVVMCIVSISHIFNMLGIAYVATLFAKLLGSWIGMYR